MGAMDHYELCSVIAVAQDDRNRRSSVIGSRDYRRPVIAKALTNRNDLHRRPNPGCLTTLSLNQK